MSKIRHILSVIHYTIRGTVCFQFTHFLVMIERIHILCLVIIIKSEVWTNTHCLGLGHETMVCAVCLFVFFNISGLSFVRVSISAHMSFWRHIFLHPILANHRCQYRQNIIQHAKFQIIIYSSTTTVWHRRKKDHRFWPRVLCVIAVTECRRLNQKENKPMAMILMVIPF